jgi:hypothetical protein
MKRHIKLTSKDIINRDDRQCWPATTILRLYKEGKIDTFKAWTEEFVGGDSGPLWDLRWNKFISNIHTAQSDDDAVKVISKFMAAQRKKKYDRSRA